MKTPTKAKLASKLARAIHNDLASTMFKAKEALRIFSASPDHAHGHDQAGRCLVQLHLHGLPRGGRHRCDARTPPGATRAARGGARRRRSRSTSTSSRRSRTSTRAACTHACRLPGAAQHRPRLCRQQAPHDAAPLQRRERALLSEREGDGDRHDRARALRAVHQGAVRCNRSGRDRGGGPCACGNHARSSLRDARACLCALGGGAFRIHGDGERT